MGFFEKNGAEAQKSARLGAKTVLRRSGYPGKLKKKKMKPSACKNCLTRARVFGAARVQLNMWNLIYFESITYFLYFFLYVRFS
ncbi:hypothetical protein Hanom_Chr09g00830961 [Helianthus anomalus]